MKFACAYCGKTADRPAGHVNRSRAAGLRLSCGRRCAGIGRRKPKKSKAQLKLEKRLYDREYRVLNREALKAKKRTRHLATYDPEKERVKRKKRMPRHVEYCRRPEYKRWKSGYDRKYRAKKEFGPFAEAAMLFSDLHHAIKERATDHEIRQQNGTINKAQLRRRDYAKEKERGRPRFRDRRDRHSPTVGA